MKKDNTSEAMTDRDMPDMENYCAFCEHAAELHGDEFVLCDKKGVVNSTWSCRHFRYDPLKRHPSVRKTPTLEYIDIDL